MIKCLLCSTPGHSWQKCPLFGTTKEYLAAVAPAPQSPEELVKEKSDLISRTLFEDLYGHDENALGELMEDEKLTPDERVLATELLIGTKTFNALDRDDKMMLDQMAHHLASGGTAKPKAQKSGRGDTRPSFVRTQDEMEDGLYPEEKRTLENTDAEDFYSSVNHS